MKLAEAAAEKSYLLTMGGGGVVAWGGASMHDTAIIVGIAATAIGLVVQCLYTFLKNRRERKLYEAQMKKLNDS